MKKCIIAVLSVSMLLAMTGCKKDETTKAADESTTTTAAESTEEVTEDTAEQSSEESAEASTEDTSASEAAAVMSYADYAAAELDAEVTIEAYVQAKQSWWDNTATVYLQDEDGAYFCYGMACSEEDYAKLTDGQKIRVHGFKSEWSGEVEIVDATFEIIDGTWTATPVDVTAELGTDGLVDKQNQLVSFTGMKVEASKDANGNDVAFLYKWDGSGEEGDDLYFNVSVNGQTYNFTVESYLCDKDSEVYKAVKELKIGDTVDMEGFLYWYEGANPHITKVTVK
ncbi:MAG: hypothetical protein J5636_09935 [Clostridiales bacterium]|nr:hypothetical protein [Clostridiales bacterium]